MIYLLTPEAHTQTVAALETAAIGHKINGAEGHQRHALDALAMLKAMKPVPTEPPVWTPCTQASLPLGLWLVTLANGEVHVADKLPNVTSVGGLFYFDREPITHYTALPPTPHSKERQ